jgi:hypothetical protein
VRRLCWLEHLFDSTGEFIAFRRGRYVWNSDGEWIGWLPWDERDVVTTAGEYLGTIFPGHRLYRRSSWLYRGYPGHPGYPGYPGYPAYPGYAGYSPLPPLTEDVPGEVLRG